MKNGRYRFWWLPLSFLLPGLLFVLFCSANDNQQRILLGIRAGVISLILASIIFCLSLLDGKIGTPGPKDRKAEVFSCLLGIMLWIVWVGTSQILLRATDEAETLPEARGILR